MQTEMELSPISAPTHIAHTQMLHVLLQQNAEDKAAAAKKKQIEEMNEGCRLAAAEQTRGMQMQIEQLTLKLAGMEATQEQFMVLLEAMQGIVKEAQKGMFKKRKKRPRHEGSDESEEEEAPDKVQKRRRGRPKKNATKQKGQEA